MENFPGRTGLTLERLEAEGLGPLTRRIAVRTAPITVITGDTGSGKSSVIKALQELQDEFAPRWSAWDAWDSPDHRANPDIQATGLAPDTPELREMTARAAGARIKGVRVTARIGRDSRGQRTLQATLASAEGGAVIAESNPPAGQRPRAQPAETLEEAAGSVVREMLQGLTRLGPHRDQYDPNMAMGDAQEDGPGPRGQETAHHIKRIQAEGDPETTAYLHAHMGPVTGLPEVLLQHYGDGFTSLHIPGDPPRELGSAGTGALQSLPVLVAAASARPGSTLMVEHPESGLHPTRHMALGSMFAQLWTRRLVRSVIETQSDNLILRLRTLLHEGKLEAGDVVIVHLTRSEEGVSAANIPLDQEGRLGPGFPMSFFGQNITEGLKLGVRRR